MAFTVIEKTRAIIEKKPTVTITKESKQHGRGFFLSRTLAEQAGLQPGQKVIVVFNPDIKGFMLKAVGEDDPLFKHGRALSDDKGRRLKMYIRLPNSIGTHLKRASEVYPAKIVEAGNVKEIHFSVNGK